MKHKFNDFVQRYKDILDMKKSHVMSKEKVKEIIVVIVILTIISVLTGIVTNAIMNLSYVVNILNTIVLGSFILYKVIQENRFKAKFNLDYNTFDVILYDCLKFVILVLTASLFSQLLFMRNVVSTVTIIVYVVIILILMILARYIYVISGRLFKPLLLRVMLMFTVYTTLLFLIISRLIPINNVMLNFIISYLVIALIFMFRDLVTDMMKPIYRVIYMLILLIGIYYVQGNLISSIIADEDILLGNYYDIVKFDIPMDRNVDLSSNNASVIITDNYVVHLIDNEIEVLDYKLNKLKGYLLNDYDIVTPKIYAVEDTVYLYVQNQDDEEVYDLYYFDIDSDITFIESFTNEYNSVIPIGDYYLVDTNNLEILNTDKERIVPRDELEYGEILVQNNDFVILKTDHTWFDVNYIRPSSTFSGYSNMEYYYSREYIYYDIEDVGTGLCDINDFASNDLDNCINFDYDLSESKISTFVYKDSKFYLSIRDYNVEDYQNQFVLTFDEDGELVNKYLNSSVIINNNVIYDFKDDKMYFTELDNQLIITTAMDVPVVIQNISLLILLLLIFFGYPYKGGDNVEFYDFTS